MLAWAKRTFAGRKVGSVIWEYRIALRSALLVVLVMLISNLATALLSAIGNGLFTRELGWDPEHYASLVGGWALVAGGVGAALGGYLADRVGHRLLAGDRGARARRLLRVLVAVRGALGEPRRSCTACSGSSRCSSA